MDLKHAHFFVKEALDRVLFKYENLEEECKTLRAVIKSLHKNGCDPTPDPPKELVEEIKKTTIEFKEEEASVVVNEGDNLQLKLTECGIKVLKDLDKENMWYGGKYKIKNNPEWDNDKRLKQLKKKVKKTCHDNSYVVDNYDKCWSWKFDDKKKWCLIDISICPFD